MISLHTPASGVASVIPLPTAAAKPVAQPRRRGRYPKCVIPFHVVQDLHRIKNLPKQHELNERIRYYAQQILSSEFAIQGWRNELGRLIAYRSAHQKIDCNA